MKVRLKINGYTPSDFGISNVIVFDFGEFDSYRLALNALKRFQRIVPSDVNASGKHVFWSTIFEPVVELAPQEEPALLSDVPY